MTKITQQFTTLAKNSIVRNCAVLIELYLINCKSSFTIAMFLLNVTVKAKQTLAIFRPTSFSILLFVCSLFSHFGRSMHLFAVLCGPCELFFCFFQEFKHPSHIVNFSCRQNWNALRNSSIPQSTC